MLQNQGTNFPTYQILKTKTPYNFELVALHAKLKSAKSNVL